VLIAKEQKKIFMSLLLLYSNVLKSIMVVKAIINSNDQEMFKSRLLLI